LAARREDVLSLALLLITTLLWALTLYMTLLVLPQQGWTPFGVFILIVTVILWLASLIASFITLLALWSRRAAAPQAGYEF